MEVSDRIVIIAKGRLEQIGTPREVYEQPANEFVARFIGVMNVLDCRVTNGVGRVDGMEFKLPGVPDGLARIGFRPYDVQISPDLAEYPFRAVLRHTFFLGVMLRLELELESGLTLRTRITKEDYSRLGLGDHRPVSFQIRRFRVLSHENAPLGPERVSAFELPPTIAENI